jgi:uncharacterized alpha-E superfamily protein
MGVLKSLTAYQMYRLERQVEVTRKEVLHFLFLSEVFPRSISFCLHELEQLCNKLPNQNQVKVLDTIEKAKTRLKSQNISELKYDVLHDFIDEIQLSFIDISNALASSYFLSSTQVLEQAQSQAKPQAQSQSQTQTQTIA